MATKTKRKGIFVDEETHRLLTEKARRNRRSLTQELRELSKET